MITINITTYRRPQLLRRAINSVLSQTYPNFLICVYDNCSGDETSKMMEEFIKLDSRIKYHCHSENIGMMANYAYAFSQINSEYFCFLSDDDYLLPCFFETALSGFAQYPEAAISSCGILITNEIGRIIADPLTNWKKEGLFKPSEGVLEMINAPFKFPVPTGVLFHHQKVKNIHPDLSKEIQILWDPDYLLKIASQFSIVINKKTCGIYLTHENSFCNLFYSQMFENEKLLDDYMNASRTILTHLMTNSHISQETKIKVKNSYISMIRKTIAVYMTQYIRLRNLSGAYYSAKILHHYFGLNFTLCILFFREFVLEYIPFLKPLIKKCLILPLKSLLKFFNKNQNVFIENKEVFHEYKEYAEKLSLGQVDFMKKI